MKIPLTQGIALTSSPSTECFSPLESSFTLLVRVFYFEANGSERWIGWLWERKSWISIVMTP